MALFSAGLSHISHLVASMVSVKITCLRDVRPPAVSPKALSRSFHYVHHSCQCSHFLLFPKPSPLHRWHSALHFLPSDWCLLQHRSRLVNMAWNPAAVCIDSDRFGHGSGQATVHGVTSHCSLLVVLLSVVATACGTAITHDRRSTIPLSGFIHCHLDSQGPDETTTGCSECCS